MNANLLIVAQLGFILITIIYYTAFIKIIKTGIYKTGWDNATKKRATWWIITILIAWTTFISVWSSFGVMSDFSLFPFNFIPVIAIPLFTALILSFSSLSTPILAQVPVSYVIHLQSFRIVVEILLWLLFIADIIPVQMTFEGRNFDILAGLSAPVIGWLAAHRKISKTILLIWNVVCLALLINIVTVAILSTPTPLRTFMNEPANTIVAYFPVSWLPGLLVPLAYMLHFFSLKQILTIKQNQTFLK